VPIALLLLPQCFVLMAGDAGEVESRVEGMRLPAEMGRDMHGGAGAAAGIGIENGT
jgi:hypothetical protein